MAKARPRLTMIRAFDSDRVLINMEKDRQNREDPFLRMTGPLVIHEALKRYIKCPECSNVPEKCHCGKDK